MISVLHLGQALYMCRVPVRQEASGQRFPFSVGRTQPKEQV